MTKAFTGGLRTIFCCSFTSVAHKISLLQLISIFFKWLVHEPYTYRSCQIYTECKAINYAKQREVNLVEFHHVLAREPSVIKEKNKCFASLLLYVAFGVNATYCKTAGIFEFHIGFCGRYSAYFFVVE